MHIPDCLIESNILNLQQGFGTTVDSLSALLLIDRQILVLFYRLGTFYKFNARPAMNQSCYFENMYDPLHWHQVIGSESLQKTLLA